MFSIVVVYNNKRALDEILLKSLKSQTAKFELIALDNESGVFRSAAQALNVGGKRAKGEYVMFVHQDIELGSDRWLENAEELLDTIPDLGIAGVVGMSGEGTDYVERKRGYISDCGDIWGEPFEKAQEVQTLDECLLIVPKPVFSKMQFDDKTFDSWHCHGADYCLCIRPMGLKACVIPGFVYHRSLRSNVTGLFKYQKRLYRKHKGKCRHIYTTCGEISRQRLGLRVFIKILKPLYRKVFSSWTNYLRNEISDYDKVLDLGCGYNSPIQYCRVSFSVGVELFEPYLEESRKKAIHNQYVKADVREIEFKSKSFDAVLCSEVLEHLTKEDGYALIGKMEQWARKKIVITTPNGYLWQDGYHTNPLQEHKSGWSVKELQNLGFTVFGIGGLKQLRGYKGSPRYKPTWLWSIVANFTQKITYWFPRQAFQLFAVKKIAGDGK